MTELTNLELDRGSAEAALAIAVHAPSIHNTQPWRYRLDSNGLMLLADRNRQLRVADPDGHSMLVSCGAALDLTELALRAAGWRIETTTFPDATQPDLLARLRPVGRLEPDESTTTRIAAALQRCSDRRPFTLQEVPEAYLESLQGAGSTALARVDFPRLPDQRLDLAVAVSWADRIEQDNPAYIAEMRHWLRDPEVHAEADGIPLSSIPHVAKDSTRHNDVPMRDFEVGVTGRQLIENDVDEGALIGVVLTDADGARDHLWAGRAMMRLMLQAQLLGLGAAR